MWGQISVGLFADPLTGPKGVFIGGHWYQLVVQVISAISLTIWTASVTLVIIWFVDKMTPIRLSAENEITGADLTEHYLGEAYEQEHLKPTLDKIISITTPVAKFVGSTDEKYPQDQDSFGRRKPFHINHGFDRNERQF